MTHPAVGRKRPLGRGAIAGIAVAVVLATAAGAAIGARVALVICAGGCAVRATAAGLLGAAVAGLGTLIAGVLVARAFAEWDDWNRGLGGARSASGEAPDEAGP